MAYSNNAFSFRKDQDAVLVFRFDDADKAIVELEKIGAKILTSQALFE